MPINTTIELRFDRHLLPSTAVRQSLDLNAGSADTNVFLQPDYDPIERVIVYRLPAGRTLTPRLLYTVELPLPDPENPSSFGFRAYDGAGLAGGAEPIRFSFRTGSEPAALPAAEPAPDCSEILATFRAGGCTLGVCHGGAEPAMGLALDSAAGFYQTAVGVVAHQTDIGPITGEALVNSARFGVGMPLISPGQAANSYLFYKLLINPKNYGTRCETRHRVPLPAGACLAPSAEERARLKEWFVLLHPMPPAGALATPGDLWSLRRFIDAGAPRAGCR